MTEHKHDIYQEVTDRILSCLEQGVVPWQQPWTTMVPQNPISGTLYQGINAVILRTAAYQIPFWVTRKQAGSLGGFVRRGSEATPVVFWNWVERKDRKTGQLDEYPVLRYHRLFNIEQCYLPAPKRDALRRRIEPPVSDDRAEHCRRVVERMPERPSIEYGGDRAYYNPARDLVAMPVRGRFAQTEAYYGTLFHELVHATGHASRLNRKAVTETIFFGTKDYSREELVAELGAAFLCAECHIENQTIEASASYLDGWLKALGNNPRLLVQAGSSAQKAVDFIRNRRAPRQAK